MSGTTNILHADTGLLLGELQRRLEEAGFRVTVRQRLLAEQALRQELDALADAPPAIQGRDGGSESAATSAASRAAQPKSPYRRGWVGRIEQRLHALCLRIQADKETAASGEPTGVLATGDWRRFRERLIRRLVPLLSKSPEQQRALPEIVRELFPDPPPDGVGATDRPAATRGGAERCLLRAKIGTDLVLLLGLLGTLLALLLVGAALVSSALALEAHLFPRVQVDHRLDPDGGGRLVADVRSRFTDRPIADRTLQIDQYGGVRWDCDGCDLETNADGIAEAAYTVALPDGAWSVEPSVTVVMPRWPLPPIRRSDDATWSCSVDLRCPPQAPRDGPIPIELDVAEACLGRFEGAGLRLGVEGGLGPALTWQGCTDSSDGDCAVTLDGQGHAEISLVGTLANSIALTVRTEDNGPTDSCQTVPPPICLPRPEPEWPAPVPFACPTLEIPEATRRELAYCNAWLKGPGCAVVREWGGWLIAAGLLAVLALALRHWLRRPWLVAGPDAVKRLEERPPELVAQLESQVTQAQARLLGSGTTLAAAASALGLGFPHITKRIDGAATVDATVRAGDFFTPRFHTRRALKGITLLVESEGSQDQLARLALWWAEQLAHSGILVSCFLYDPHRPERLYNLDGQAQPRSELSPDPDQLLLVVGHAHPFAAALRHDDSLTGWLRGWQRSAVLSHAPQAVWGEVEVQLQESGVSVIAFDAQVLDSGLSDLLDADKPLLRPPAHHLFSPWLRDIDRRLIDNPDDRPIVRTVCSELRIYLGPKGYRLLQACAAFPRLHWAVTLYLEAELFPEATPEEREVRLLRLIRLPWFRGCELPTPLREELVARASEKERSEIRERLRGLMRDLLKTLFGKHAAVDSQQLIDSLARVIYRDRLTAAVVRGMRRPNRLALSLPYWLRKRLGPARSEHYGRFAGFAAALAALAVGGALLLSGIHREGIYIPNPVGYIVEDAQEGDLDSALTNLVGDAMRAQAEAIWGTMDTLFEQSTLRQALLARLAEDGSNPQPILSDDLPEAVVVAWEDLRDLPQEELSSFLADQIIVERPSLDLWSGVTARYATLDDRLREILERRYNASLPEADNATLAVEQAFLINGDGVRATTLLDASSRSETSLEEADSRLVTTALLSAAAENLEGFQKFRSTEELRHALAELPRGFGDITSPTGEGLHGPIYLDGSPLGLLDVRNGVARCLIANYRDPERPWRRDPGAKRLFVAERELPTVTILASDPDGLGRRVQDVLATESAYAATVQSSSLQPSRERMVRYGRAEDVGMAQEIARLLSASLADEGPWTTQATNGCSDPTVLVRSRGEAYGSTAVYLEGRPNLVRTEETNLGNLTADANLWYARQRNPRVQVSIKNGGGIHQGIGSVDSDSAEPQPPPNGQITQLDIVDALRFNNGLALLELSARELSTILEQSVGLKGAGTRPNGRFPQVGGLRFSFDPNAPIGNRIVNAVLVNETGDIADILVQGGRLQGDPARRIDIVTLDYLADGGDGYTFPQANRLDLRRPEGVARSGNATFAPDGTEQDALAEYLIEQFNDVPYDLPESRPLNDQRIQNLDLRQDTVIDPERLLSGLQRDGLIGQEALANELLGILQGRTQLKAPSESYAVIGIQRLLTFLGYPTFTDGGFGVDGVFGAGTNRAVALFQLEHGITVGSVSRNLLINACRDSRCTPSYLGLPFVIVDDNTARELIVAASLSIANGRVINGDLGVAINTLDYASSLGPGFELWQRNRRIDRSSEDIWTQYGAMARRAAGDAMRPEWLLAIIDLSTEGIPVPLFDQDMLMSLSDSEPQSTPLRELRMRATLWGLGRIVGDRFAEVGAESVEAMATARLEEQIAYIARYLGTIGGVDLKSDTPSPADFRSVREHYVRQYFTSFGRHWPSAGELAKAFRTYQILIDPDRRGEADSGDQIKQQRQQPQALQQQERQEQQQEQAEQQRQQPQVLQQQERQEQQQEQAEQQRQQQRSRPQPLQQ